MFEQIAYATDGIPTSQQANPLIQFMPLIAIFVIFYFFLIRPQQKQQQKLKDMIAGLKKGDKVVTSGGIIGEISSIQQDYLVLTVGDSNTKIEVLKGAITGLRQ